MSILVQKYGGSSVADVERIGLVADQVVAARRAGHRIVVVVSAMGKTTDGLLALAQAAARTGAAPGEPSRRELDMLVSTGERVSMALLSIALHARGEDAISFTGSQSGILTTDRHFDARIVEVRPHRIEEELARGRIVIVAGYQGMSLRREITTLGRGGSDTTAVALAAALGAERCEIYSDVDGVYSADPRVVAGARHLPEVSFPLLQELAESGAKVLNAQAVEWARRAGITLHARKTGDGPGARETVAREAPSGPALQHASYEARGRAVASLGNGVSLEADGVATSDLLEVLEEAGVTPALVTSAGGCTTAFVSLANVPDWQGCRGAWAARVAGLRVHEGRALVSVVGDGLTAPGALPRALRCLGGAGVAPAGLFASPLRLAFAVDEAAAGIAQRALHDAFVAAEPPPLARASLSSR